jgi:LPS O-antigen subunit length determinant protein (WzzB/FepE family)
MRRLPLVLLLLTPLLVADPGEAAPPVVSPTLLSTNLLEGRLELANNEAAQRRLLNRGLRAQLTREMARRQSLVQRRANARDTYTHNVQPLTEAWEANRQNIVANNPPGPARTAMLGQLRGAYVAARAPFLAARNLELEATAGPLAQANQRIQQLEGQIDAN